MREKVASHRCARGSVQSAMITPLNRIELLYNTIQKKKN